MPNDDADNRTTAASTWDLQIAIIEAAKDVAVAWSQRALWMNRRVDTLEFKDAATLQFQTSIDITVPSVPLPIRPEMQTPGYAEGPIQILPLMCLKKNSLSIGFDIYDEAGGALWRIQQQASQKLGGKILSGAVRGILLSQSGRELIQVSPPLFRKLCRISEYGESDISGERRWKDLQVCRWNLTRIEWDSLFDDKCETSVQLHELVSLFAENYLLCVGVEQQPGRRKLIRIRSDVEFTESKNEGWIEYSKRRLGWSDWPVSLSVSAADARSYHCEIRVPEGVRLRSIDIEPQVAAADHPASAARPRIFIKTECAHLAVSHYRQGYDFWVHVKMRVLPSGWLNAALASSAATAILLGFTRYNTNLLTAPEAANNHNHSATPHTDIVFFTGTLFLAAVAAMIAILIKESEHQLTSRLVRLLRAITYLQITCAFSAALVLVFAGRNSIHGIFTGLWVVSCLLLTILSISYFCAKLGRPDSIGS
ncbi:hypothetical protein [Streptomyces sp. NPDC051554]|uniref:hypothetical protein n=1 Tax=Streptomyces sp. NPDC051554 TaxID=3365656 RepID=UPI0037B8C493